MCDHKFYVCKICGNIVGMIFSSGVEIYCCGEPMTELEANTVDASKEKHVPAVTVNGDTVTVTVGAVAHPMVDAHYIQWIYLETEHGGQRKCLSPGDAPTVSFALKDDKPVAAYAYCNLHGLWKAAV